MTVTVRDTLKTSLETSSGRYLDLLDPQPEDVSLEDIARALSLTCRYGGQLDRFYSVAEHAVLVSNLVRFGADPTGNQLAALHHDDHEAYIGDLPTPLKNLIGATYHSITERLDVTIAQALDLDYDVMHHENVKWADAVALRIEAHTMKHSQGVGPHWTGAWEKFHLHSVPLWLVPHDWNPGRSPEAAEQEFLEQHEWLSNRD